MELGYWCILIVTDLNNCSKSLTLCEILYDSVHILSDYKCCLKSLDQIFCTPNISPPTAAKNCLLKSL